jgi:hypothetical protein
MHAKNPNGRAGRSARYQRLMAEHQVLFCPFCRESFEGLRACPDHDLPLVSFDRLPPDPLNEPQLGPIEDDSQLDTFEPRFGRVYVALGALATSLSLPLDFVRFRGGSLSTLSVAQHLPALWTPLLVTFTLLYTLRRRRSLRAMRSLRVLIPALALVAPMTLLWELSRFRQGATLWGRVPNLQAGSAVYVSPLGGVEPGVSGR